MSIRPVNLLRLGLPAALVAAGLVTLSGSSSVAAEPGPYRPPFVAKRSPEAPKYEPNTVVVKFKAKVSASARRATVSRLRTSTEDSVSGNVVKLTGNTPAPELLKKVKADPSVELASLNYERTATAVPNDPFYPVFEGVGQAPYLNAVRMPQAWDVAKTTGNQVVAVLDTGVDAGHPDLAGRLVPGYNAVSSTRPNPVDDNGHGTMTLGIIAANTNNGIGVAGVGWQVKAMPVKVLASDGRGYDADIAEGIDWAVAHGAKVINMSLGGPEEDGTILHDAIKRAVTAGVVVVASAGNDGDGRPQYPAAYPEVVAVGATNASGVLTDFSSYGDWVDLAAPGWDLISTGVRSMTPPGYEPYWYCTGTSCSAPIVSGVAALAKNKWPALTPAQVTQRLKVLARDAGPRGIDPYYGWGVLDAYQTLGGRFAPDFPGGADDGNGQPAKATKVSVGASTAHKIDTEGDVDWYSVESPAARNLRISVTGPSYNVYEHSVNFGPLVRVFNQDLQPLGQKANPFPAVIDPDTGDGGPLTAAVDVSAAAGTTYIAVSNSNGSRDNVRQYSLQLSEAGSGGTASGVAHPVRDVAPTDFSATAALTAAPVVTFAREVVAASVTNSTVRLVSGKTGAAVPAQVEYDAAAKQARLTPSAMLTDATPYKIVVSGVQEAGGTPLPAFTSVFSTKNLAPPKLASFTGSGAYLAANLAWKLPPLTDLDQVIVRRNVGSTVPTPTTGTLVYAGTGSALKVSGLAQGTTYTFGAWAKDRAGNLSLVAVKQLLGTKVGISTTSTLINYGGSITLRGSLLRIDNKASAGLPVALYARPKNVAAFKLLATLKTSSTGTVSYVHKPAVSTVYAIAFLGSADWMGARTPNITVEVKPTISAALTPTSIRLGQTTKLAGYVTPAHYGYPVWLQQYSNKVWRTIATVKLSRSGAYAFGIRPAARGQIAYRAVFPADADHATAISIHRIVTIS